MSCLPKGRIARIQANIASLAAQKTAIEEAFLNNLSELESYNFDSGEARQATKNRSFEEMQKAIDFCDRRIEWYYGKLNGTSVVKMNLRRKDFSSYGFHGRTY